MTSPIDTAYVEIKPDVSRFPAELDTELGASFTQLSVEVDRVIAAIETQFAELAAQVGGEFDVLTGEVATAFTEMRVAADVELNQIQGQAEQTTGRIGGLFSSMAGLLKGAVIGIATGLGAAAAFGLKSAANFEQVQIALESLTGSVSAGMKQFQDLQTFAAVTPFEFKDLTTSAERFDAFSAAIGQSKNQLVPFLTTIGNLVSETGGGAQALDSITLALGQTASQGKLTLGNLDQINNALPGFSSLAALAAVRGQTTAQVMQQISSGSIDAKTGINQLLEGMQRFPGAAGAMAKQSQTLLGVFSTFHDTVSQALSGAFQPVIPAIKDSLNQITPIVGATIKTIAPALGQLLAGLLPLLAKALQAVTALVAPILAALGPALKPIGDALDAVGKAFGEIAKALAPVLPMISQLVVALIKGMAPIISALTPLFSALVTVINAALKPLIPVIVTVGKILGDTLGPILKDIAQVFVDMAPQIGQLVQALAEAFVPLLQALAPIVLQLWDAFKPLLPAIVDLIKPVTQLVIAITPIIDILAKLLVLVVDIVAPIIKFLTSIISLETIDGIVPAFNAVIEVVGGLWKWLDKLFNLVIHLPWGEATKVIELVFTKSFEAIGHAIAHFFTYDIPHWFGQVRDAIGNAFAGAGDWLYNAGKNLLMGLINGIKDMVGTAVNAVEGALSNVVDGAKNFLGIHSPSTVFVEIGQNTVAGYTKGVSDPPDDPAQAMLNTIGRTIPGQGAAPNSAAAHSTDGHALFGPNSIVIVFSGVVPTHQEALQTGQAVGTGIAQRLATRNTVNGVRTL